MTQLDYGIVGLYLVGLLLCGFLLAKKASEDSDAYFLGGRRLPWWALGASGMSSNLDTAGTMTIVTMLYLYGVHGFFIEMRGGVVLPIAVFLAFMGKWHQRSGVVTTGEWMRLRFGEETGGKWARGVAALTYLVITIGMIVFFLAAAGKFLSVFLPFSPNVCAVGMALIALVYTLMSGLYGVVWTDVFQGFLIVAAALFVSIVASGLVTPELLANWDGSRFNTALPRLGSGPGEYGFFSAFLLAWIGKGTLEGLGGSGGSAYMAQRFYAARSSKECQLIGMLWAVLFAVRWPMALGFAIMAVYLGVGDNDPEALLPQVLNSELFPAGARGIVIAALLAASMSTFDSTINAGASYVVKDLFLLWKPRSSERAQVWVGYVASALIVAIGLVLAIFAVDSVLDVWVTIVIQLFPAFLVPFALRWFWWRMNGEGFSLGVLTGFLGSLSVSHFAWLNALNEAQILLYVGSASLVGCVVGTYFFAATDERVLKAFYDRIRPNGWWPRSWKIPYRIELGRNWIRLALGILWQVSTFMLPMFAVLKDWERFGGILIVWLITGVGLWLLRSDD